MDFSQLKEVLNTGDPQLREWFLVSSYHLPWMLSLMYVVGVKIVGPTLMKNRKPFDLRVPMIIYNFVIVICYLTAVTNIMYFMLTAPISRYMCNTTRIAVEDGTYMMGSMAYIIYVLKYAEFLDTVFFVMRKKDHLITNLHVVHHATLPLIIWSIFRTEISGFQFFPAIVNSTVHIIMYMYYGLAAIGPSVREYLWWKRYLTILQMLQFVVIFFFMTVYIPMSGCKTSTFGMIIDAGFAVLFFAMFYNYYYKTYNTSKITIQKNSNICNPNDEPPSKITRSMIKNKLS